MAIKGLIMKKTIENQIQELREIIIKINQINKMENKFSDDDVKQSKKLGASFNKVLKSLLCSEDGVTALIELLEDESPVVSFIIARNLYPMFPLKSMEIMKNYLKYVSDKLEKMRVQDVIQGFESKQKVFIDQFKKLYNCEDLDSLNRERDM